MLCARLPRDPKPIGWVERGWIRSGSTRTDLSQTSDRCRVEPLLHPTRIGQHPEGRAFNRDLARPGIRPIVVAQRDERFFVRRPRCIPKNAPRYRVAVRERDFEVHIEGHEFAIFTPLDQIDEEARSIGREGCGLERTAIECREPDLPNFPSCKFENDRQRGRIG